MLEMSLAPRSINFQSLLHLRTGQCESEVARVKPADLLFTVSSQTVESDSNSSRHCDIAQCRTYRCVEYIYMYNICTCMCRPAICSILPLNLCVQHLDNVWTFLANTVWAGPCCWYWFKTVLTIPTSAGFCGVQPESLLLKLLEIGLKFRKKHT